MKTAATPYTLSAHPAAPAPTSRRLMKACSALVALTALVGVLPQGVQAQTPDPNDYRSSPARNIAPLGQEVLDQILAPIALYPDNLLSHVLMAATHPDEIRQAAQFVANNPQLQGAALEQALSQMGWQVSVQAVAMVPSVLHMMAEHIAWVQQLGDAFTVQDRQVMHTVQYLRQKAYEQGSLQSTAQQNVLIEGDTIAIEPATQGVVYVPYYNPSVVYGSWWWPAYPPYYWAPVRAYRPVHVGRYIASGIVFGSGVWVAHKLYSGWRPGWREGRWSVPSRGAYPVRAGVPTPVVITPPMHAPVPRPPGMAAAAAVVIPPVVRPAPIYRHDERRIEHRNVGREDRRMVRQEHRQEMRWEERHAVRPAPVAHRAPTVVRPPPPVQVLRSEIVTPTPARMAPNHPHHRNATILHDRNDARRPASPTGLTR